MDGIVTTERIVCDHVVRNRSPYLSIDARTARARRISSIESAIAVPEKVTSCERADRTELLVSDLDDEIAGRNATNISADISQGTRRSSDRE